MTNRLIAIIAISAGVAVGLLLSAKRRARSSARNLVTINIDDEREAELIQQYAPAVDAIARKEHLIEN